MSHKIAAISDDLVTFRLQQLTIFCLTLHVVHGSKPSLYKATVKHKFVRSDILISTIKVCSHGGNKRFSEVSTARVSADVTTKQKILVDTREIRARIY